MKMMLNAGWFKINNMHVFNNLGLFSYLEWVKDAFYTVQMSKIIFEISVNKRMFECCNISFSPCKWL